MKCDICNRLFKDGDSVIVKDGHVVHQECQYKKDYIYICPYCDGKGWEEYDEDITDIFSTGCSRKSWRPCPHCNEGRMKRNIVKRKDAYGEIVYMDITEEK